MEALETHVQRQIEHSRRFFWQRLRWRLVREHLPAAEPFDLVDVGAGAGLVGDYLTRDLPKARYRFIEPLQSLEAHLEARFGPQANARREARFDGAGFLCLLDVLEHQEDDVEFMRDLAAKMKPGAKLLVTVPALMGLWSSWDVALGHYRRYDRRSLRACGQSSGLAVREVSYLFAELVPAALVRRLRNPAVDAEQEPGTSAEFPDLPDWLNSLLYLVGRPSIHLRRFAPFGSSVFAVLEKP